MNHDFFSSLATGSKALKERRLMHKTCTASAINRQIFRVTNTPFCVLCVRKEGRGWLPTVREEGEVAFV